MKSQDEQVEGVRKQAKEHGFVETYKIRLNVTWWIDKIKKKQRNAMMGKEMYEDENLD